jgi:HD domain
MVFTTAAVAAAVVSSRGGAPDLAALALFCALGVFSAALPVQLSEALTLSPGLMVCMAAIVVFGDGSFLVGAMIVGALTHIRLAHFNRRAWGWLPFNAGLSSLAYLGAVLVYVALPRSFTASTLGAVVAALPVTLAYLAVTFPIIIGSYVVEGTRPWRDVLGELVPATRDVLPFAILGFLLGRLYLDLGAAVIVLIIVPIVVAREMFAAYMKVKTSHDETVAMLIRALETKDCYTAGHSERVAQYAAYIGKEFSFGPGRMERLRCAALMHDIGKLVVPNRLLNKPGRLTREEFDVVRRHEHVSVAMLSRIDALGPVSQMVADSRHDLFAELRSLEAHVIAVADAYDAMASTRSYRQALPQEVVFAELRAKAGTQFLAPCVEALIAALVRRGESAVAHEAGLPYGWSVVPPRCGVGSAGLGDLEPDAIDIAADADDALDLVRT